MRIEKEIVETENGFTKDGIDYYYLKTYHIYSDKGTYVGAASIECTAKGFEPGTSITFQSRYDSLVERAKRLDKEESQEQEQNKPEENSYGINHGVNFLEGKPCSTLSGNIQDKITYEVNIICKKDGITWLHQNGFESKEAAQEWVNKEKNKVNEFIGDMKVWKPGSDGELKEEPLGITFDDEYTVEIKEIPSSNESSASVSDVKNALDKSAINDIDSRIKNLKLPAGLSPQEITSKIQSEIMDITNQISTDAITELITYTTSLPGTIPSRIQKHTMDTFNELKTTMSIEFSKLGVNVEDEINKANEKRNEKLKSGIFNQAQKLLGDAQKYIEHALDEVDKGAQDIAKHAEEGISYVRKKIRNFIEPIQKEINSKCMIAKNTIETETDKMCKNVGESIGQTMAKKYNKAIEIAAKEQYQKIETSKKKAITKAYAAKQKATLKIMGMLGFSS